MKPTVIQAYDLGKRYRIGERPARYNTLRDSLIATLSSPARRLAAVFRGESAAAPRQILWALRNLNFQVKRGEVVGIIGRNGAGKSTLLKVLSRITPPTRGRVEIQGRVSSLLEVGTGFHPELTGRENIQLNGAILGMSRAEINRRFDEIAEFAEVGRFIETPVKYYSSGMYVRLAFAVAAHLEPDIMLVDEVLAVGDAGFQEKCLGKLDSVTHQGRTVLFVSHNLAAVRRLCSRAILLEAGRICSQGETEAVLRAYVDLIHQASAAPQELDERRRSASEGQVRVVGFRARGSDGGPPRTACPAEFKIAYGSAAPVARLRAAVAVKDPLGVTVFVCSTSMQRQDFIDLPAEGEIACRVDWLPLIPGKYRVDLKLTDEWGWVDHVTGAAAFSVLDGGDSGFFEYAGRHSDGSIIVPHNWAVPTEESENLGSWAGSAFQ